MTLEKKHKSIKNINNKIDLGVPIFWLATAAVQGLAGTYFAVEHLNNFVGILATLYFLMISIGIIGYHFVIAYKK